LKQIFNAGVGHQLLCKGFMTGPLQFPSKLEISWQVEAILKKSHEHKIGCLSVLFVETGPVFFTAIGSEDISFFHCSFVLCLSFASTSGVTLHTNCAVAVDTLIKSESQKFLIALRNGNYINKAAGQLSSGCPPGSPIAWVPPALTG
jgi:hypothetical protein